MLYTINYSKRNSFFNKKHDIYTIDDEGRKQVVGSYNKPNAPGSTRIFKPQFKKGTLVTTLSQKEINDLVSQMDFFDSKGEKITTANIKNMGDKFFKHQDVYVRMSGGNVVLDDELPMDKFFLECFRADPRFLFVGGEVNPAVTALVSFTVTKVGDVSDEETKETDSALEAMQILLGMDFQKQLKVLHSMGIKTNNPEPKQVRSVLYKKITEEKTQISKTTGETNLELFIRLSKGSTSELELREIIQKAWDYRILNKKPGNKYYYGDLELGRSLDAAYKFLSDDENVDLRAAIIKAVEHGKNTD